ncbi:tetratricopeptide repeat protein [Leisingera aquimarina]|uniref:tetratricopeptide repeat protein n=1 Tax=Leisingera aquimarina TaxID=476529 RepID=UPI000488DB02|nr:tetratricopeptide repeat protein [Leisingera aquimarina]
MRAIDLLDRSLALRSDYAPALAFAAWCRVQRVRRPSWSPAGPDDFGDAVSLARRAIAAGSGDATSMAVAGFSLVTLKVDQVAGLDAVHHAVSLNPESSFVSAMAGSAMIWCGHYEAALDHLNRCVAYGTKDPGYYLALNMVAAAELLRGQPEAALEAGQRAVTLNPGSESAYWVLAAAQVRVGRLAEARTNLERFLERAPGSTIASLRAALPFHDPETMEAVLQSLSEAGLPD